jgi:uncharacterized protein with GYD domain
MVRAFIMTTTSAGTSTELQQRVCELDPVLDATVVAGEYDIVAEAESDEVYTVIHAVATEMHELDGVIDTRTYICLE